MYIYGDNTCSVNNECEYGYSLYFPCIKTITRGENACFDFYIVDNSTKEEIDLRDVDDITLNISGRYNCNFGSFSYPEKIKSLQNENFSELIYNIDLSNIINHVSLYIDIVDENHKLIERFHYDKNLFLDIAIEGFIGCFLNSSDENGILNLNGYDTNTYMFLGWNIEENDEECDFENIYDFLIKDKNLRYYVSSDLTIRAVYQKRRKYTINMADDNYNSSFIVEYMGKKTLIQEGISISALEGHDIKISCIPNDIMPYEFFMWDDGYKNPYRILNVCGDNLNISLKAYCKLNINSIKYEDNIDVNSLNKFKNIYPIIRDKIFVERYFINDMYINNCEIDVLNGMYYIKINDGGNIQIININKKGNIKLSLNNIGGDCRLFTGNYEVLPSLLEKNEFIFNFNEDVITLIGKNSCIFGLNIYKEIIYDKGKCTLCLDSDDTLKLHPGELIANGGVVVNENPYGIFSVKIAKVTNVTPLIIK